jgi:beta-phosphoglucomutase-like phosphatase (HAD superfamily)
VGLGLITAADVDAVHRRLEELAGPFDAIEVCLHHPRGGCTCLKPQPDLVARAASRLGVPLDACVVVGDTIAGMRAAPSAGAAAILVLAATTRPEERHMVPCAVATFEGAVAQALEYQ